MITTTTVSDGITYTQEGPAVLTGDRNLLRMSGPRRISAEMTLSVLGNTVATLRNSLPTDPSGGNELLFDLSDAIMAASEERHVTATLDITPRIVAAGTIDSWQTLNTVTLTYIISPGRTLADRSYASADVLPVSAFDDIYYYFPGNGELIQTVSGDDIQANNGWNSMPWDGQSLSATYSIVVPGKYIRGSVRDGYSNTGSWTVRLWPQVVPPCASYGWLKYWSHDGCLRSVVVEVVGRTSSGDGLDWHNYGLVKDVPQKLITNVGIEYTVVLHGVPGGAQIGEILTSDYLTFYPSGGAPGVSKPCAVVDTDIDENIYRRKDYTLKLAMQW